MNYFVKKDSIVREIWGKADTILFIFAGASAEFALNKAVDWLYFTGKLPDDPLGRLFSTVDYAKDILFAEERDALAAIDQIVLIHQHVEDQRGSKIPEWAYHDVLFMLIDYSIRAYEVLERKLSRNEKEEVFKTFHRLGTRMGIKDLPIDYPRYLLARERHLKEDLEQSECTIDLYRKYRKHLGHARYELLKQAQMLVVPSGAQSLLPLGKVSWLNSVLFGYKISRIFNLETLLKNAVLPSQFKRRISALDAR